MQNHHQLPHINERTNANTFTIIDITKTTTLVLSNNGLKTSIAVTIFTLVNIG